MTRNAFDIVGVGFGPSNLALSVCADEHNENLRPDGVPLKSIFFERQAEFVWHEGMLIDDATMQVSYLKDLVTLRNPTSRFSFLNYLKQHDRLEDFINLKTFYPTRVEYCDYLRWVAGQKMAQVRYGHQVEDVRIGGEHSGHHYMDVVVRNLATQKVSTHSTRNLVIATGLRPKLPPGVSETPHVVHSSGFLGMLERLDPQRVSRFLVVGGGQSAAEVVNHLHDRYQDAQVVAVFPTFGYKPADDSHFVNQIFDPQAVDLFYDAPDSLKAFLLAQHSDTNYSVVDSDLIAQLYRKMYDERVRNRQRLTLRRLSRLEHLHTEGDRVRAHIRDIQTGTVHQELFDAAVLATGYRTPSLTEILPTVSEFVLRDAHGQIMLDRSYAVKMRENIDCRIYLQGMSENQHGITSTLLSVLPIRAQEIVQDILKSRSSHDTASSEQGLQYVD